MLELGLKPGLMLVSLSYYLSLSIKYIYMYILSLSPLNKHIYTYIYVKHIYIHIYICKTYIYLRILIWSGRLISH